MDNTIISTELAKFNLPDSAISQYRDQYLTLRISDIDDKEGYALVRDARLLIKRKRVEVEKTRKRAKERYLRYGQAIDAEAKRLSAALDHIECHLYTQEKAIDDKKERIRVAEELEREKQRAALLQARVDQLQPLGAPIDLVALASMSEEEFSIALEAAQIAHECEQERLAVIAQRERFEQEERERIAAEEAAERAAERKALADARQRLEEKEAAIRTEEAVRIRNRELEREILEEAKKELEVERATYCVSKDEFKRDFHLREASVQAEAQEQQARYQELDSEIGEMTPLLEFNKESSAELDKIIAIREIISVIPRPENTNGDYQKGRAVLAQEIRDIIGICF